MKDLLANFIQILNTHHTYMKFILYIWLKSITSDIRADLVALSLSCTSIKTETLCTSHLSFYDSEGCSQFTPYGRYSMYHQCDLQRQTITQQPMQVQTGKGWQRLIVKFGTRPLFQVSLCCLVAISWIMSKKYLNISQQVWRR